MAPSRAKYTLAGRPALLPRLRAEPTLLDGVVAETLRLAPPVIRVRRTARHSTELRGTVIHKGQDVVGWIPAAQRDPEVFADPDRFDPYRSQGALGGLAGGPAELLSRLAVRVMLAELVLRADAVETRQTPRWLRSVTYAGPTHDEIRLRPRRR
jgi:cytochrome P450